MTVYATVPFVYLREFRDRFDVIVDSSNGMPFFSPLFSMKPKICVVYHVHRELFKNHLPRWLRQACSYGARDVRADVLSKRAFRDDFRRYSRRNAPGRHRRARAPA